MKPGAHAVQRTAPLPEEKVPGWHGKHADRPVSSPYVPGGHIGQVDVFVPSVGWQQPVELL